MAQKIDVKNLSNKLEVDRITTNKYKSKVVKEKDWSDKTIVPMTTDIMFKTMFANTNRKKYLSRLLSYLLNLSEKEIFDNFEYFNVELDKDYVKQKNLRADIVGKLYGVLINVEMNKKPTLDRISNT